MWLHASTRISVVFRTVHYIKIKNYSYDLTFSSLPVTWCTNKFNIQQLYALSTLYSYVLYLSANKQCLVPLTA